MTDTQTTHNVGQRLKDLRQQHQLSQRELAKRAGVTNSTVSLIELNTVSPSVSSLRKILDAIPVSLSEFFAEEATSQTKFFYRADELVELGDGHLSFRMIGNHGKHRAMTILHERYPSEADTGADMLSHDGEEGGIIVEGEIELTVDGETRVLKAGDGYYFDSSLPHRFRNVGDAPCVIVSANTPPTFSEGQFRSDKAHS
ncbi:cupin domain-containing protein [Larsenimonas suaedae]|uniref:Cupin domain-containing protein n=1 Tax=Larsenimonas suaedae TaxID=1851019 RepID=A0ABU1GXQ8_9GAMM|nr:cupin domain-containing protein [Larsenimonas suaedae]MCM2971569.1 cupin domain-containing protein [Larsenimonas suaedae]MDR5896825.1 cupin domain-containing protein [Larsenimonas suaedae]